MSDSYREAYREEALELLTDLEGTLLELENAPEDMELIGRIFRALHTIKGSGAMFGFDDIASFVHDVESVYDRIRDGKVRVTREIIDATLKAKDQVRLMLEGASIAQVSARDLTSVFKNLLSEDKVVADIELKEPTELPLPLSDATNRVRIVEGEYATYRIRFRPDNGILLSGTNPVAILNELNTLGECRIIAQLEDIPDAEEINAEQCYTYWDIILTTNRGIPAVRDVFVFVEDSSELIIDVVHCESEDASERDTEYKKLGEILVTRGDITEHDLEKILREKRPIGEILLERGLVTSDKIESALVEQQHVRDKLEKNKAGDAGASSIRVSAEKLDRLVNLVGELVTVQARFSQTASLLKDSNLNSIAEEVERLTSELRDNTLNMRMLPIGTTFGRFKRLIRDLSVELSKKIDLTTEGAETELDKTVIERLSDPLIHLIRNSVDHGIEPPDRRLKLGKPETGVIHLSAMHSGANVVIEIRDDGSGLSKDAILARAIEKGLISPHAELTDKEIFNFVFLPGFSTAAEVTNISGRGVGMDVVRKEIERLKGSIDIASMPGVGTTVTIKLPLTLAIINGLLVSIGQSNFVLPLSFVQECVELTEQDIAKAHGKNLAYIRGDIVPYIRLRNEFSIPGKKPEIEQIVITGTNDERVGFVVDNVIGEHQTVIKNLGKFYQNIQGVSGATILGDGTVAMILDVPKLINVATGRAQQW